MRVEKMEVNDREGSDYPLLPEDQFVDFSSYTYW
jgi:hypothetical protein